MKVINNLRINKQVLRYIYLIIFLGTVPGYSYSMENSDSLSYKGTINSKNIKYKVNEIQIQYTKDDGFSRPGGIGKQYYVYPKISDDGYFEFKLPDLKKPYKIGISIYDKDKIKLFSDSYYVETGDNIFVELILKDHLKDISLVQFSGKGSEKFVLLQELALKFNEFWLKQVSIGLNTTTLQIKDPTDLNLNMERFAGLIREFKIKRKKLFSSYSISREMQTILEYEFANYNIKWRTNAEQLKKKYPLYCKQIYSNYFKYDKEFSDELDDCVLFCPGYIYNLSFKRIFEMSRNCISKPDPSKVYQSIKAVSNINLRDRIIGDFLLINRISLFVDTITNDVRDSLLNDASHIVKNSVVKEAILKRIKEIKAIEGNSKVINAKFFTIDGKEFQLSSLKGKVVLIDTWFLGCFGCLIFHEEFEKDIYPLFKNNEHFTVLSVNISAKKDYWEKGINSGKYTSDKYINVNTGGGVGSNHPFMNYYGIKSAPYFMLLDALGNIVYVPKFFDKNEMIQKIKDALNSANK